MTEQFEMRVGDVIRTNWQTKLWQFRKTGISTGMFKRPTSDIPDLLITVHRAFSDCLPLGSPNDIFDDYNGKNGVYTYFLPYKTHQNKNGIVDTNGALYWTYASSNGDWVAGSEWPGYRPIEVIKSDKEALAAFDSARFFAELKQNPEILFPEPQKPNHPLVELMHTIVRAWSVVAPKSMRPTVAIDAPPQSPAP